MLFVSGIVTPLGAPEETAVEKALSALRLKRGAVRECYVSKTSVDARHKGEIHIVSTVALRLKEDEASFAARFTGKKSSVRLQYKPDTAFTVPHGEKPCKTPVVVAGFGPAGIFAAGLLAREGYRVMVLERGYAMEQRVQAVESFWAGKGLDIRSNVQFGEGGAGTFSDGKLTTRINDPLCGYVLETFGRHGAPAETLRRAKPHIGTDKLRLVVRSMREEIIARGGEIRFGTALDGLKIENGHLTAVRADGEWTPTERLVLAVGHSARDTFRMALESGLPAEPKPFSVGVRVEQLQSVIDRGLYGSFAGHPALPPGEYQLSLREGGRAVYTFCMCPGGLVVPAASEEGGVVTNGMSEYNRDRENANAALAVSVSPADFGPNPMDGVRFQRELEERAFRMGGGNYRAPVSTADAFLEGKPGLHLGKVAPSYALGVEKADFDALFPPFVTDMLRKGLRDFGRRLPGFAAPDTVLTGVETRTSSPIRLLRDDAFQSPAARGLYPCGEGAGYAGGIMSAAVDGLRVAAAIIAEYAE